MLLLRTFFLNNSGATSIEYALIAILVSVAAIGAMTALGGKIEATYTSVANQFK